MQQTEQNFSIGIEEEYLLVNLDSMDLEQAPAEMMQACQEELQGQVSPEFLQCQIEIGTRVCASVGDARDDLLKLRSTIARIAKDYNLAPLAAACHPFADWQQQHHTDGDRYNALHRDLAGVARRMLICGMHIHVGLNGDDLRIDMMNQFSYFLPHLLALSTSSPFWKGWDTGLGSYRLAVFDNLPRTGLPPRLDSYAAYQRSVDIIIDSGLIQDSSKIWWDLRPSSRFPTLETRICDVSPRLNHTLSIAAINQCIMRMLYRLRMSNQRWRIYDRFLIGENRWRAQRYGISEGLIDFGRGVVTPFSELTDELIDLLKEDAEALGCMDELQASKDILATGTSADRQRAIYNAELAKGQDKDAALRTVVKGLVEEFHTDL